MTDDTTALEDRIGHRFTDPTLLREALTHPSASGRVRRAVRNNERLEFLGDRVLGLVVATLLLDRFPDESEGALTRRHAALVRSETLAEVAAAMDLGRWLVTARSEDEQGRGRPARLANALEALIGAVYLDGGFAAASRLIEAQWGERLISMTAPPRDAKTTLQEWAQARGLALPVYTVLRTHGPAHAPEFEVEVRIGDVEPARAAAASKRAAEQAAAERLLARVGGEPCDD